MLYGVFTHIIVPTVEQNYANGEAYMILVENVIWCKNDIITLKINTVKDYENRTYNYKR